MLVFYVFHTFSPVVASIRVLGQVLFTLYALIEYTEYMSWCFSYWDRKSIHPSYVFYQLALPFLAQRPVISAWTLRSTNEENCLLLCL